MTPTSNLPPLVKFKGFNGVWSRGADANCPEDHLTDCYNCTFPGPGQVSIREAFGVQNDIPGRTILSFAVVQLAIGPALLTLNNDGTLYDETHETLLGTFTGADDFVVLSVYGRAFISLKTKQKAYSGGYLYYYDGVTFGQTGWEAPATQATLTQPNAGTTEAGVHVITVCFISPTGYLSSPGPAATINSDGSHTITITNIPTGPAGTTGRVLLASKADQSELFFVPGGTINDNTTTTFEYDKHDASLVVSADYLNNLLYPIPSCAAIKFYRGRLVLIGRDTYPDSILVSNQNDPETFNLVNNVFTIPPEYGANTSAGGMVIRDILYITKPNATYSVVDNGGEPGTWTVSIIDSAIGAFDCAISVFASSMSAQDTLDSCIIANKRGVLFFGGTYPDTPLTYKIESIWQKINQNVLHKIQVAHDVWAKRVYLAVPLAPAASFGDRITADPGGENNLILLMDYQEGLTPQKVRWSVWTPEGAPYTKISVENFLLNYSSQPIIYQLAISGGGTCIYKLTNLIGTPDVGHLSALTAINQYIITPPIFPGGITVFNGLMIHFAAGNKAVTPSLTNSSRNLAFLNQRSFALNTYDPAVDLFRGINFQDFGLQVMLKCSSDTSSNTQSYFHLHGLDIYGKIMYPFAPALSQTA